MNIVLITPAGARSRYGNRGTAVRWARMLRQLGHRVRIQVCWDDKDADAMIALHARRSHDSIKRYATAHPTSPLVLTLTGTDLYRDIRCDTDAQESMRLATRMIVLQDMGLRELAPKLRRKTRVVYQSAQSFKSQQSLQSCFEVIVSGHLRMEKDPFRAAAALAHLPNESRIRITHVGGAMSPEMEREARVWMKKEPRYRWLGEVTHGRAMQLLARAQVMVISSRMEGGANVVCEALAVGTPVIASRVSGNIGMLGANYAGYYSLADERALAKLLWRAESDAGYLAQLRQQCRQRKPLMSAMNERRALKRVLDEIS
jgi:putative glycosyltransferase (TIGR04348 family)